MTAQKCVGRIKDELLKVLRPAKDKTPTGLNLKGPHTKNVSGVIVGGDIGSCMVKFSRCCTPVPGDDIVGFITKGYGVSIHRRDCVNAKGVSDPAQSDRWVNVIWANSDSEPFSTTL